MARPYFHLHIYWKQRNKQKPFIPLAFSSTVILVVDPLGSAFRLFLESDHSHSSKLSSPLSRMTVTAPNCSFSTHPSPRWPQWSPENSSQIFNSFTYHLYFLSFSDVKPKPLPSLKLLHHLAPIPCLASPSSASPTSASASAIQASKCSLKHFKVAPHNFSTFSTVCILGWGSSSQNSLMVHSFTSRGLLSEDFVDNLCYVANDTTYPPPRHSQSPSLPLLFVLSLSNIPYILLVYVGYDLFLPNAVLVSVNPQCLEVCPDMIGTS